MNRLIIVLLTVVGLMGCGPVRQAEVPDPVARELTTEELVDIANGSTVAFVGTHPKYLVTSAFCTGVFVSQTEILTAAHCVIDEDDEEDNPFEGTFKYVVQGDVTGIWKKPRAIHGAQVIRLKNEYDLALLKTVGEVPVHKVAVVGEQPKVGERLALVGHPSGYYWTYMEGTVSGYREDLPMQIKNGPFMQLNASIWMGNSGGGAFDKYGHLVGVASFLVKAMPNCAMYVHRDNIAEFLSP